MCWAWCVCLVLVNFFFPTTVSNSDGNSNTGTPTLYYKEHRIRTEQLCPDLQESTKARDIDTANYPYKSVFKLADQVWRTADPCIFEARGARNQYTTVAIKAIQADNQPWNYSGAQSCSDHIKLRLPNRKIFSKTGLPICTVRKPTNPAKLFQGPFYHPHVWQLSKQKMGISFSIYENETMDTKDEEDGDGDGSNENNEISQPNGFLLNAKLPKFIYIVFASFYGETCSLRVQQYLVDPTKGHCNASAGRFYSLCGVYNCSDEEKVLKQAGFWSDSLRISELQKLIDFMRSKQYRQASEPSIMDFFVNLMRLMIMPMVFLVAYYVTRQLREKLANRQLLLQMRSQGGGNSNLRVAGARVGVSIPPNLDSPSSVRRERFEDPPPSYETIITPPSYLEATKIKTETLLLSASPSTSLYPPPPFLPNINFIAAQAQILPISDITSSTTIIPINSTVSTIPYTFSAPESDANLNVATSTDSTTTTVVTGESDSNVVVVPIEKKVETASETMGITVMPAEPLQKDEINTKVTSEPGDSSEPQILLPSTSNSSVSLAHHVNNEESIALKEN